MNKSISKKIELLNETTLDSLIERDILMIVIKFIGTGLKLLEADYGFVWWKVDGKYSLIYKSPNTPYNPKFPREKGGNFEAIKTGSPIFIEKIIKSDYDRKTDVSSYMKSYVIIPICYKEYVYGNIVLCFKKKHKFSDEDKVFSTSLGNATAQAITINRLVESEFEARSLSEKNEAYFRALIKNSNEIIIQVDEKGKIQYVSPSVFRVSGYKPEEMVETNLKKFLYDGDSDLFVEYLKRINDTPRTEHLSEFQLVQKNGSLQIMEFTALNMLSNPSIKGIIINIRDITVRKNLELIAEHQKLIEDERKKMEFIAEANHELRTPIAIIKGNVDLILREARPHAKRRYADDALRDIDEEVTHITNILSDFSLLTSGETEPPHKKVDLSKVVNKAIKRWKIIASKKKISIRKRVKSGITILGEEKYLDRIIINLIKNAITYGNENGWVTVELKANKKTIELKVKDNGIGIAENDLPHIFERFFRADKSHSGTEKHSGLGLAISKWIVESHGGTIRVASKLGKGTTFYLSFPKSK